jgi:hypothetical protein
MRDDQEIWVISKGLPMPTLTIEYRDENERLAVVAPRDGFPARVLDLVNLDRLLSIFETRAEALRAFEAS